MHTKSSTYNLWEKNMYESISIVNVHRFMLLRKQPRQEMNRGRIIIFIAYFADRTHFCKIDKISFFIDLIEKIESECL
jgi:hemerythrin-like domain-containing protein